MYNGTDYYPEHLPQSRWRQDASLIQKAGFNLVRLGKFAWSLLEPEEAIGANYKNFQKVLD